MLCWLLEFLICILAVQLFICNRCHLLPAGWRTHHAPHSLDAPREHHVQEILHGKRCLELRSHLVGDLYLWEAALVSTGKQWGKRRARSRLRSHGTRQRLSCSCARIQHRAETTAEQTEMLKVVKIFKQSRYFPCPSTASCCACRVFAQ